MPVRKQGRGVGKQKQQYLKRTARYEKIMIAALLIERRGDRPTCARICRSMGVSVSTHMRNIINELTSEHQNPYLHKLTEVHWNGREVFVYIPNHEALRENCQEWYNNISCLIGLK